MILAAALIAGSSPAERAQAAKTRSVSSVRHPGGLPSDTWVTRTKQHRTGRNGRILFQRYVGSVQQLFTINPNGTGLRRLTNSPETSETGNWSADGLKDRV